MTSLLRSALWTSISEWPRCNHDQWQLKAISCNGDTRCQTREKEILLVQYFEEYFPDHDIILSP